MRLSGGVKVFRPQGLFPDRKGPLVEGQGLVEGAHSLIQPGQVVEADGDGGVFRAQDLFINFQGPLGQGQGLLIAPGLILLHGFLV